MGRLDGKRALVTGASRGIGECVARRFSAEGARLFLAADGTEAELAAVARECGGGAAADFGLYDLTEEGAAERMVEDAAAFLGGVDILVNNAGVRSHHSFGAFSYADFERVVAVNLRGPFFASQAVLPHMRAAGGGRIVHMASQLGSVAAWDTALYGATKAALIQLARSMAFELARENILVNALSPGPTATEYLKKHAYRTPEEHAERLGNVPVGRFGEPMEIANAALFLASGEASFVQGHNLVVDGGYVIH